MIKKGKIRIQSYKSEEVLKSLLNRGAAGGLPSMGSHRVGHDWSDLAAAAA